MKRLVTPTQYEGLPYVNQDFYGILQNEHMKSYISFLDGINDVPLKTTATMCRGIVLSGLEVNFQSDKGISKVDLENALVYIPGVTQSGDFYEPLPALLQQTPYIAGTQFFIYINETNTEKNRRQFFSGSQSDVTIQKYFDITDQLPLSVTPIPHIRFEAGVTNRKLSRILKWHAAEEDEIFITGDSYAQDQTNGIQNRINNFNPTTGLGEGDMFGFALCNGQNGTFDLRGRMVIGYDVTKVGVGPATNSIISGTYNSRNVMNYGTISNVGGGTIETSGEVFPYVVLQEEEMFPHGHKLGFNSEPSTSSPHGETGEPNNLDHLHDMRFSYSRYSHGTKDGDSDLYAKLGGYSWTLNSGVSNESLPIKSSTNGPTSDDWRAEYRTRTLKILGTDGRGTYNIPYLAGAQGPPLYYNGEGLATHTHSIDYVGESQPHETRPPYFVLAYYQKINPYI